MIFVVVIVVALAILFTYLLIQSQSPSWKGKRGEESVSRELNNLSPEEYIVLDDLMLSSRGNTSTTQIDHIVISNYGLFCIETKAYKGWIFGGAKQKYWTQVIYEYKNKFYNPLWQNFAHIKAIEGVLGPNLKAPIISLIVFTKAGKLQVSGTDSVVDLYDIVEEIQSYSKILYTDEECDDISELLIDADIVDEQMRKSQIEEVRALKR